MSDVPLRLLWTDPGSAEWIARLAAKYPEAYEEVKGGLVKLSKRPCYRCRDSDRLRQSRSPKRRERSLASRSLSPGGSYSNLPRGGS
jgi:hypothetical protein